MADTWREKFLRDYPETTPEMLKQLRQVLTPKDNRRFEFKVFEDVMEINANGDLVNKKPYLTGGEDMGEYRLPEELTDGDA